MPDIATALTTALNEWQDQPTMIKGAVGTPTISISAPKKNNNWVAKDASGLSIETRVYNAVTNCPGLLSKGVHALMPKDNLSSVQSILSQHARAGNMYRDENNMYYPTKTPRVPLSRLKKKDRPVSVSVPAPKSAKDVKDVVKAPALVASPASSPQIHDVFKRWTPEELLDAMPVRYAVRLRDALGSTFGGAK